MVRAQIQVRGIVQGVGFRPFVCVQARQCALRGEVRNNAAGVMIDVEGESAAIERLIEELQCNPPPLARIESIRRSGHLPPASFIDFRIVDSAPGGEKCLPVAADCAVCEECLREMNDPASRRYRYPFINCTRCGPRFTIIEDVPYDRPLTTMREFAMCAACQAEYSDPSDRRFHAEATACPACGPQLYLTDRSGRCGSYVPGGGQGAVEQALLLLGDGKILALKGIGGFHLACDALNAATVERLRQRKYREDKPFAMMARSVDLIRRYCRISPGEEALLASAARPIVLLQKKPGVDLPRCVAPRVATLGFMLPYAPLHHLLLDGWDRPMIMTSANLSDEPIAYRDGEAIERLGAIADYFVLHDRRIHMRADDSVARVHAGRTMVLRRSRGLAPEPIRTAFAFEHAVLACGAHLKNTFCLGKGNYAFVSHHIGDLENFETLASFTDGIEHFKRLFDIRPVAVAHDLHPDFLSTRYALGLDRVARIGVQHHHAHIAACMTENHLRGPVVGVAFDGTGLGSDGAIWGGEFLIADLAAYERRAHLRYVPLAGGDTAIRQPWRSGLSYLRDAGTAEAAAADLPGWGQLDEQKLRTVDAMMRQGVNTVQTSSCGRLFDAAAAIVGLRHEATYEGQAAIELETIAIPGVERAYPFDLHAGAVLEIDLRATVRALVADILAGTPAGLISATFHNTVAAAIVETCGRLRAAEGLNRVCLSGGVFQNLYLLTRVSEGLERGRFEVFRQRQVPVNDGGISLGQAAVANERLRRGG